MQRGREREESIYSGGPFDSFGSVGGFGSQRSMRSSIFGGRDPFDDPFFTRPFGSIFGSSMFNSGVPFRESPQISRSKEPIIEELHTDDEEEENVNDTGAKEEKNRAAKYTESNDHPHVEHPDEETDDKKSKDVAYRTDYNKARGTIPQAQSVSFQKVTYGGINGTYYTGTTTRRTGNDGVVLEECRQADRTTGQATHRISRGIHDKGLSVTRKLGSDGKVDTMQTLHNLNEDELGGFEQAWKGDAERHFPGWDGGLTFNGTAGASGSGGSGSHFALPFEGFSRRAGRTGGYNEARASSSDGRPKKVVAINIE
ncbi:Heme A synthase [Actinidia chinensis var. chinensis]|uniref:Heme A synthase n=1 Tax=Actinidia chinensis var. chinensis TaxID=1590841 RepID=A0A2R6R6E2_ACTCC|nr:Heme A synthase [Actinidia chinensis var. chinensis]